MGLDREMKRDIVQKLEDISHFHADVEILYVVRGQAQVWIKDAQYLLDQDDVILINSGLKHRMRGAEDSIFVVVKYSARFISSMLGKEDFLFICNSVNASSLAYDRLGGIFQEMIFEYIDRPHQARCLERSLLYKLLGCLCEFFLINNDKKNSLPLNDNRDERLEQIFRYVNQNFQNNISLSELAHQMFTSVSTLSRLFKKQTGIYFAEYVNQVRLSFAWQELIYSDHNITKIAVDSGFSNLSVFNRLFRQTYAASPSEYRKKEKPAGAIDHNQQKNLIEKLRRELEEKEEEKEGKESVCVCVDTEKKSLYQKGFNQTINIGSINTMLMANIQYHVLYLVENLGFRYVRLWNMFSTQMMVTDGIHTGNYNYDQIDIVFDFLSDHNIYPFLDFGVRPTAAVRAEDDHVYFGEECVEFQSRKAWEEIIEDFMKHVVKRYGKEKVSHWIFELSYDIRHKRRCYLSKDYDFFHAYRYLYQTVKGIVSEAEVGGPMGIVHFSTDFMRGFLELCKANDCVPDFVSILLFPYITIHKGEEISYTRAIDQSHEQDEVNRIHSILKEAGLHCKVYVSEWNNTLSSRNFLNDSCYRAAYFVSKMAQLWEQVDMISVWMASDWVSNYFDVGGVANGGNGLLTKDTICKPAYYALQFLSSLGEYLIAKGNHYIVTGTKQQDYYILCFNYKTLGGSYFLNREGMDSPNQLKAIYDNEKPVELEIIMQHIRPGRYVVKKRTVSPKEGSLLCEWEKFDYDNLLSSQEVKYIRQICFPRLSMRKIDTCDGELRLKEVIGAHEIVLIHIYEN